MFESLEDLGFHFCFVFNMGSNQLDDVSKLESTLLFRDGNAALTIESAGQLHGFGTTGNNGGGGRLINQGTLVADVPGQALNILQSFTDNAGSVQVVAGATLAFGGQYTQTAGSLRLLGGSVFAAVPLTIQGGLVTGNGTITGSVTNTGGTISPGLSAGSLAITGDLTLGADAVLSIEVGGLIQGIQYDLLSENGATPLSLAGTLSLSLINGFIPQASDSFTVLTSNQNLTASFFSNVAPGGRLATIDGSGSFQVNYGITSSAVVLNNFVVPEPGTGTLCLLSAGLLGLGRRRNAHLKRHALPRQPDILPREIAR